MDIGVHVLAQGLVYPLMPPYAGHALELGADDNGLEMLAVAHDMDMFARKRGFDPGLDLFGSGHIGTKFAQLRSL